jgi:hypothetical protein
MHLAFYELMPKSLPTLHDYFPTQIQWELNGKLHDFILPSGTGAFKDKKQVESVALVSAVDALRDEHEGGDSNRTLLYALGALGLGLLGGAIFVLERGKEVGAREADQYIIVDVTEEVDYER